MSSPGGATDPAGVSFREVIKRAPGRTTSLAVGRGATASRVDFSRTGAIDLLSKNSGDYINDHANSLSTHFTRRISISQADLRRFASETAAIWAVGIQSASAN